MKSVIQRIVRKMIYATPAHRWLRVSVQHDQNYWDAELAGTLKTYLGGTLTIDARNALTLTLMRRFVPGAKSLLDVGCASGSLHRAADDPGLRYVGVDISATAITQGKQLSPSAEFHLSPLAEYEPPEQFDIIVMNEVLYYMSATTAAEQVRRYAHHLRPDGGIIISMKHDPKSEAIFAEIRKSFIWVDGLLFQEKIARPDFRIRFDDARPAYLLGVFHPRMLVEGL
jgi:2-polyprenyl-3-methyl-5-hydroxy-6-metoxy-1,4-benzoquinol methylase